MVGPDMPGYNPGYRTKGLKMKNLIKRSTSDLITLACYFKRPLPILNEVQFLMTQTSYEIQVPTHPNPNLVRGKPTHNGILNLIQNLAKVKRISKRYKITK